jgi:thiamine biosynthesis lipoprotein
VIRVEQIMGMPIVVDLRDAAATDADAEAVFAWLRGVDTVFSTYREDSEVRRLDRGELALEDASADVRRVLGRGEELRIETRGFFDMRYGGALDPSGLVKGWAVEMGSALLSARGLRNHAVSAGGDMALRGGALPDAHWTVGIQHPLERDAVAAVVEATDCAVATSGTYARGEHVLDPHTGTAPAGILSVTITGPDVGTADAYATAAFAMGTDALHWVARLGDGYEGMLILADGRVLSTPAFPSASTSASTAAA